MPLTIQATGDTAFQGSDNHITVVLSNTGPFDYPGGDNYRIQIGEGRWNDFGVLPPVPAGMIVTQNLAGKFGLPAGTYPLCLGLLSPDYLFSPTRYYAPDYIHWTFPLQTNHKIEYFDSTGNLLHFQTSGVAPGTYVDLTPPPGGYIKISWY